MELIAGNEDLERLNSTLSDPIQLEAYKTPLDGYKPLFLPRLFGTFLVFCGNVVYGEKPSYLKFRAVEVIARVPYHSWASAAFTMLTLFYTDEARAIRLSNLSGYARIAQDNETMHVIVISQLARKEVRSGIMRHTLIPMFFAFFYYVVSYVLYMLRPRWSYELNYLFESHAFEQYDRFITIYEDSLRNKSILSDFLARYGRNPISQYDFFKSVRNDELIHRNQSIHDIDLLQDAHRLRMLRILFAIAIVIVGVLIWFCGA